MFGGGDNKDKKSGKVDIFNTNKPSANPMNIFGNPNTNKKEGENTNTYMFGQASKPKEPSRSQTTNTNMSNTQV